MNKCKRAIYRDENESYCSYNMMNRNIASSAIVICVDSLKDDCNNYEVD